MKYQETSTLPFVLVRNAIVFPGASFTFRTTDEEDKKAISASAEMEGKLLLIPSFYEDNNTEPTKTLGVGVFTTIEKITHANEDEVVVTATVLRRAKIETSFKRNFVNTAEISFPDLDGHEISSEDEELFIKDVINAARANVETFKMRFQNLTEKIFSTSGTLGEVCDRIAGAILVSNDAKEEVFIEFDEKQRAITLINCLTYEADMLAVERDIFEKVRDNIGASQKNMFLREQMKVIKSELGEDADDEVEKLYGRLENSAFTEEIKDKLIKELRRMSYFNPGSPDYALIKGYIETCLELPLGGKSEDSYDIARAKKILERDHDGLTEIKERIIEFLAVSNLKPDAPLQVLCLVGPPGTGKTSVAKSIASAMNRKFVRVSLGGVRDESDIRGHRKTYVGAMPGRIVNAFLQAKTQDPVILLDEIDKMGMSHNGDPASALLEVLDMEQNSNFRDHYIEIPYDLSNALFITTANTLSTVPRPLLDRMEIITLHSYSREEKLSIAKHHLIPKQMKRHGVPKSKAPMSDKVIYAVIDGYTKEAGVRNLEREIASIARKCAVKIGTEGVSKVSITLKSLESFLGPKKILEEKADGKSYVGVTNGLAYTELGGDLLKIEACVLDGNGKLELTGSLGDVMKESAKIAISAIRQRAESAGIDKDFHKTKDIHIHVPEGAVPKDGPSAGVTLFTTLYSALSGKEVRGDVAMTGELTLTGRVLPIGGLKEKSMAALAYGITKILIPKDNLPETKKFDSSLTDAITYIPCQTIDDVIRASIV